MMPLRLGRGAALSFSRINASTAPTFGSSPATSLLRRGFASVGDKLPSVELHLGFPPEKHNLADFAGDKSILLIGLPGAFTPT